MQARRRLCEEITEGVQRLPTLPVHIQNIIVLLEEGTSTAEDIAREIIRDQALSADVLRLVNSGFYGISRAISSIEHATVMLGFNVMRNLVLSSAAAGFLSGPFQGLYHHSLACSKACGRIAKHLGGVGLEAAASCGLLHDIGKVLIHQCFPDDFKAILEKAESEHILISEAEMQVLGVTHAELGAALLRRWNVPDGTWQPIEAHHFPRPDDETICMVNIIRLADIIVRAEAYGYPGDDEIPPIDEKLLQTLGLKKQDLSVLVDEIDDEIKEIPRYLGKKTVN